MLGFASEAGIFLTATVLQLEKAKDAMGQPAEAPPGPVLGGIRFWAIT